MENNEPDFVAITQEWPQFLCLLCKDKKQMWKTWPLAKTIFKALYWSRFQSPNRVFLIILAVAYLHSLEMDLYLEIIKTALTAKFCK